MSEDITSESLKCPSCGIGEACGMPVAAATILLEERSEADNNLPKYLPPLCSIPSGSSLPVRSSLFESSCATAVLNQLPSTENIALERGKLPPFSIPQAATSTRSSEYDHHRRIPMPFPPNQSCKQNARLVYLCPLERRNLHHESPNVDNPPLYLSSLPNPGPFQGSLVPLLPPIVWGAPRPPPPPRRPTWI